MEDLEKAIASPGAVVASARRSRIREALRETRSTGVIDASAGLPGEFADYAQGAWAWQNGRPEQARESWLRLLERPEKERRYKSTWAAYMLGRSSATNEPDGALRHYQQVRALAAEGFADTLGLAAASYGWEAQLHLREKRFLRAFELYLLQLAAGDPSAVVSLRETARRALADGTPAQLDELARTEATRRVISGWLVSGPEDSWALETQLQDSKRLAGRWLLAIEQAGIRDLSTGEHMALAAYQAGDMGSARRWIQRAPGSATAQWLNAKLWLRAGKVNEAAKILTRIAGHFPLAARATNDPGRLSFEAGLVSEADFLPAAQQFHGELGVLRLVRREYSQALDALLRSDFWMDAAYVAERVLTLEELKNYVDRNWPSVPPDQAVSASAQEGSETETEEEADARREARQRRLIRHLLGRRLARTNRAEEASPYVPESYHAPLEKMLEGLRAAADEASEARARAAGWWQAAQIVREHGLELLGTELEPDWAVHGGDFEAGVTGNSRLSAPPYAQPSSNELTRIEQHAPALNKRFHYRYTAAAMGWQAAKFLPDNDDETARVLCTAGSWIKVRDPEAADVFYKSLVRRCRKTAIGAQADQMRWFPILDAAGNPLPPAARHPGPSPSPEPRMAPEPEPSDTPAPEETPCQ